MTFIEKISFSNQQTFDLLPLINRKLQQNHLQHGICSILSLSNDCCILSTEPDARAIEDILDDFKRIIPATIDYLSDKDPHLCAAYTKSSLIGSNRDIPIKDGKLYLGTHQGLYLLNFLGTGVKEVAITFIF